MANYKETTITGSSRTRCNQIQIINPLGAVPQIHFDEQTVLQLESGNSIVSGAGSIDIAFDAAKQVPVIDLDTHEPTGQTVTYGDIYVLLYSAYIDAALARDAELPPPVQPLGA